MWKILVTPNTYLTPNCNFNHYCVFITKGQRKIYLYHIYNGYNSNSINIYQYKFLIKKISTVTPYGRYASQITATRLFVWTIISAYQQRNYLTPHWSPFQWWLVDFPTVEWLQPNPRHVGTQRDDFVMTSSNGNIFRVDGHLSGEFTGDRGIPRTKASDTELWCFLWHAPE